ncbi:MAG TPA: hypothetical protein ENJ08_15735 [Gammaproteobacteria bacterium]|nr:hypothetical protein [Gammaproteobacteria bacterium]
MRGLSGHLSFYLLSLLLVMSSMSQASVNPFKKSKSYNFGSDISWDEHNGAAIKSGRVRDGSDTNYYHLNVNKYRLQLRLGRNDPSGELENTRLLESLTIADVLVDGHRLPVFNWCLQNQRNPGKKLKHNATVPDNICQNTGGGGDFIIRLDKKTRDILKKSGVLEFIVEPYGRPVKLRYSMSGFATIMTKIETPKKVSKPVSVARPATVPVAKPVARPAPAKPRPAAKPRPVVKKTKMCNASPPEDYKPLIKSVAYPCADATKKSAAEEKILGLVDKEKEKEEKKKKRKLKSESIEHERLKSAAQDKRNIDWDNKQAELWISRCERHWKKGNSPCYCEKFIKNAPPGTKNTCKK